MQCATCGTDGVPGQNCLQCGRLVQSEIAPAAQQRTWPVIAAILGLSLLAIGVVEGFFWLRTRVTQIRSPRLVADVRPRREKAKDLIVNLAGEYYKVTRQLGTPVKETCCARYESMGE